MLFAGMLLVSGPFAAQTVYRCGNAYSAAPCPNAAVVDVDDARSPLQQAQARDVAAREAALASRMVADRQRAEALTTSKPARVARAKSAALPASAPVKPIRRYRPRLQDNGQGDFVAVIPRASKK